MIPFLVVTCAFRGVHVLTRTPLRSLFLIVLIMSDFMGLVSSRIVLFLLFINTDLVSYYVSSFLLSFFFSLMRVSTSQTSPAKSGLNFF